MNNKLAGHKEELLMYKIKSIEDSMKSCRSILIQIKGYMASINKRISDMEKNNGNK